MAPCVPEVTQTFLRNALILAMDFAAASFPCSREMGATPLPSAISNCSICHSSLCSVLSAGLLADFQTLSKQQSSGEGMSSPHVRYADAFHTLPVMLCEPQGDSTVGQSSW